MSCFIHENIEIENTYTIESSDGTQTGVVLIRDIDVVNCSLYFDLLNGSWKDSGGLDFQQDFDIKIYYNDLDFCILNPAPEASLWVQTNLEQPAGQLLLNNNDIQTSNVDGPVSNLVADVDWWLSSVSADHPTDINSGQQYSKWRCLENLRCFARKDPYTGEVYPDILDYWVAYDANGNKVYIKHPFRGYAEHTPWNKDDGTVGGYANENEPNARVEEINGTAYGDNLVFEATTDLNQPGITFTITRMELSGYLLGSQIINSDPSARLEQYKYHDAYQVHDIRDDGRACLVGWYVDSFFMSYGARPVQELFASVELVFDFSVSNNVVDNFSIQAIPRRHAETNGDNQYPPNGIMTQYAIWAWVRDTYSPSTVPIGGIQLDIPVAEDVSSWETFIQYVGSFYQGTEVKDIFVHTYIEYPNDTTNYYSRQLVVVEYGGLYNVYEEFLEKDSTTLSGGFKNVIMGHLLNFQDEYYLDYTVGRTELFTWGWSWDMLMVIYGDEVWGEGGFDIHGSCRCCSLSMYYGDWTTPGLWEQYNIDAEQRVNRSAFITPDGIVGDKSDLYAGFVVYSGPSMWGNILGYPGFLYYNMLPDKASRNPVTGQIAGISHYPLSWEGEWVNGWENIDFYLKGDHIKVLDINSLNIMSDQKWMMNYPPETFWPTNVAVYG